MWTSFNDTCPVGRPTRAEVKPPFSASVRRTRPTRRRAGFLLLEVLVATTLLAVGVTACLRAIFNSLQGARETQMYTQALFLAQKVMSVSEIQVAFNDEWDLPSGWRDFDEAENYQYQVDVEEVDDFWTNRISVSVRWANNPDDIDDPDKNFYYRIVTEVPRPRYPEDYRK
jgi:Tfp pilus assembly protein PilV